MGRTYRNRSQLVMQLPLAALMTAAAAGAAVYWLGVAGVGDRAIVVAAAAGAAAWIVSRFWPGVRGRVRTGPDGVEIVDGFGAVEVPWTAIEAFRIVGAAHEVPQVVMERADGEPLRLRPLEGHGWTLNSGRRSMERDVAALNAELARRRR